MGSYVIYDPEDDDCEQVWANVPWQTLWLSRQTHDATRLIRLLIIPVFIQFVAVYFMIYASTYFSLKTHKHMDNFESYSTHLPATYYHDSAVHHPKNVKIFINCTQDMWYVYARSHIYILYNMVMVRSICGGLPACLKWKCNYKHKTQACAFSVFWNDIISTSHEHKFTGNTNT